MKRCLCISLWVLYAFEAGLTASIHVVKVVENLVGVRFCLCNYSFSMSITFNTIEMILCLGSFRENYLHEVPLFLYL